MEEVAKNVPSYTAALLIAIGAMSSLIISLLLYIRNLHNKHVDKIVELTKDHTRVTTEVKNSIDNNTKAMDDVHSFIRNSQK